MVDIDWDWSGEVDVDFGDNPVADWAEDLVEEFLNDKQLMYNHNIINSFLFNMQYNIDL